MNEKVLEGKVMLVTGAGRGIGRAIAILAAHHGASVVVNDLGSSTEGSGTDSEPADEVVENIMDAGGSAVASTATVDTWDGAQSMVDLAMEKFGRLDCVVNNAGILRDRIFHKMAPEDFEAVIDVHLKGSFFVSRAAAPLFRDANAGCFVHMTSTTGLIGNVGQTNYGAAKLGIVGLSKGIALDMKKYGVRSNCISPFAWSRMIGTLPTDTDEARKRRKRLEQMKPEKVAVLAVALCSDQSSHVTGQIFAARRNELFLFNQTRPVRAIHDGGGWSPSTIVERALPALEPSMTPLDVTTDIFGWDPV